MTGSEVGRILICASSAVLPQRDEENEYSSEGVDRHSDAEDAVDTGDMDALPCKVAELIADAPTRHTEVVFSYDAATDTAMLHVDIAKRGYPKTQGPFEIFMTLDLLALSGPDGPRRAVVIDYKLYAAQGRPREHGQLMTQALAVARVYGLDEVTIAIAYLGTGWVDHDVVDIMDLDVHAERLRQVHVDVAAARLDPMAFIKSGSHCRHCKAFHSCPEQVKLVAMARAGEAEEIVERSIPFSDDDAAADAYEFLKRLRLLVQRLNGALVMRAKERPIPIGGGMVYGWVVKEGNEKLNGEIVYTAVGDEYGRENADLAVEMVSTKKRIKDASTKLKKLGKGKSAAEIEKRILTIVRERGGVTRKQSEGPEEFPLALSAATTIEEQS